MKDLKIKFKNLFPTLEQVKYFNDYLILILFFASFVWYAHFFFYIKFFKAYSVIPAIYSQLITVAVPFINLCILFYLSKNDTSNKSLIKYIAGMFLILIGLSFTFALYQMGDNICNMFANDCLQMEQKLIQKKLISIENFLTYGPFFLGTAIGGLICAVPYKVLSTISKAKKLNYNNDLNMLPAELMLNKEESLTHEYKSFFQTPINGMPIAQVIKGQTKYILGDKEFNHIKNIKTYLQTQSLKTIVAFLNTEGGNLIIGVQETKGRENKFLGVENEVDFLDVDNYERHFVQQIINRIGDKFASGFIRTSYIETENKKLFCVNVKKYIPKKGEIPAMLDKKDTFRRTGPRTDRVQEGEQFARFISERQE